MKEPVHRKWQGRTDGTPTMQRALVLLFKVVPLEVIYVLMAFVVPFYMVVNRKGFLAIYRFFRQRLGKNAFASVFHVYGNHFAFGQVVLDRFAAYAGRRFKVTAVGNEHFLDLASQPGGFMMLSSHVGCFEMAGYTLLSETKQLYALVYGGESEVVAQGRQHRFQDHCVVTVPVSQDLSHLFLLNKALDEGQVVTMPADRIYGSSKCLECHFFGAQAKFPMGPFATAVQKQVPVLAVTVTKEGRRHYVAHVALLETDSGAAPRQQMQALAQAYASALEEEVRKHPHQWYNFYQFWNDADD